MPIPRKVNHDFFATWRPDMAYALGFFAADGTMIENARGGHFIEFHITDQELLKDIRRLLDSDHKISARVRDPRWKLGYRMQIGSKQLFGDLAKLGFTPSKSNTMELPTIPDDLVGEYVRGYFDGDGCVYFNILKVSDRKKPRPIFQTRFTSGSDIYLKQFQDMLHTCGVRGGYLVKKQGTGFELVFSHHDGLAIYEIMYNNTPTCGVHLERKKRKFDQAIESMYHLRA